MGVKKFGIFLLGLILLVGCAGQKDRRTDWGTEWADGHVGEPAEMVPEDMYGPPADGTVRNVAVLLPMSGPGGNLGTGIRHAIEIAFFQKQPENILISFHDLSGRDDEKQRTINNALANNPDLIIGPLFADDVAMLGNVKPRQIPAITFTSARHVLGNGVFTMALLPNQAIEMVVKHMKDDGRQNVLILAPDTNAGHMLTNTALEAARIYNIDIAGLFLYEEDHQAEMKNLAEQVTLYRARVENLTRAKEILSEILIRHRLTNAERENLRLQLEDLNRRDSLGDVPYDAILFLGNAVDSKSLAAYLRYFDATTGNTAFFGSALWDTDVAYRDSSLAGGTFAALPPMSEDFVKLFSEIEGVRPNRFDSIGYDAAMLSIKALSGRRPVGAYLLDPSGYVGIDGLVRLRPNGENERALQIMRLNGVRLPTLIVRAPPDFTTPIFRTHEHNLSRPRTRNIISTGYNPLDYLNLPPHLRSQFTGSAFGANIEESPDQPEEFRFVPAAEGDAVQDEEFQPAQLGTVDRRLIDEVQMRRR